MTLRSGKMYLCRSGWFIGKMIALKSDKNIYLFSLESTFPHTVDEYDEILPLNKVNLNKVLSANCKYL